MSRLTPVIRPLVAADVPAAASIMATYTERSPAGHERTLRKLLDAGSDRAVALVAVHDQAVVGLGRVRYFEPAPTAPSNAAPAGWYLLGLNVMPEYRRRGVGTELTRARLEFIAARAATSWYFASQSNRASIALHEAFGFRFVTTDFWFPRVSFRRNDGALFRRDPV